MATLLARAAADTLWDGAYVSGNAVYRDVLRTARGLGRPWRRVAAGDSVAFDGVMVTVLAPDSSWLAGLARAGEVNEASVVLQLRFGRRRFLLTGDAEGGEEAWMVARYGASLASDVLKVGHHGSVTSTTPDFLDVVRPRVAVVSVGSGNRYGHPSQRVLQALDESGAYLLRTDDDGTIVVSTDGKDLEVRANGGRWRDVVRGR